MIWQNNNYFYNKTEDEKSTFTNQDYLDIDSECKNVLKYLLQLDIDKIYRSQSVVKVTVSQP